MRRAIASLLLRWAHRLDNERREEEASPLQPSVGAGGAQQSVPVEAADASWIATARMRARALGVVRTNEPQMKVFASQFDTEPMSARMAFNGPEDHQHADGSDVDQLNTEEGAIAAVDEVHGAFRADGVLADASARRPHLRFAVDRMEAGDGSQAADLTQGVPDSVSRSVSAGEPDANDDPASFLLEAVDSGESIAIKPHPHVDFPTISVRDAHESATEVPLRVRAGAQLTSGDHPSPRANDPQSGFAHKQAPGLDSERQGQTEKRPSSFGGEIEVPRDDALMNASPAGSAANDQRATQFSSVPDPHAISAPIASFQPQQQFRATDNQKRDPFDASVFGAPATPMRNGNGWRTSTAMNARRDQNSVPQAERPFDATPQPVSLTQARMPTHKPAVRSIDAQLARSTQVKTTLAPATSALRELQPRAMTVRGEPARRNAALRTQPEQVGVLHVDVNTREYTSRTELSVTQAREYASPAAFAAAKATQHVAHDFSLAQRSAGAIPIEVSSSTFWPALPDEVSEFLAEDPTHWPTLPDEVPAQVAELHRSADAAHLAFLLAEQRGEPWNA